MRRILLILAVLALPFAVSAQSLTILHMNDTHSHIEPQRSGKYEGMGGVMEQAAFIDSVRFADGESNVLLLHAGDFGQGTSYFSELGGDIEIDVINAMAFDAVCLGNHEFDNGIEELGRRLKNIRCDVLCANYDFTGSAIDGIVKPYAIYQKAGKKIGVFGLLTDLTSVVNADIAAQFKYAHPAEVANKYAKLLKKEGCDLVIALTHLGYEGEDYTDFELAAATRNIDVIVGGHSHTYIKEMGIAKNLDGKKVVIVTDGKWGLNIGKLTVK